MAFGLDADWASIQVKNHPIRQHLFAEGIKAKSGCNLHHASASSYAF
jgi:hypothetical protein